MAATPPITEHLDLSGTFGVVFWAFVVSTVLFGVSVVQGYFYFMHNDDNRNLRIFVACMIILDFSTTALSSQSLYDYLIVNFGNPLALEFMTVPYIVEYFITAVVTLGSQLFYASRIYIVFTQANRKSTLYGIPLLISALAIAAFGMSIGAVTEIFNLKRLIVGLEGTAMMTIAGLNTSLAAVCDIIATLSMCIFLASRKSDYKQTRTIISTLLFISINRGVLVAIAQLGFLTAYLSAPSKIYWMPFHLSVSKLHVNTLLAMLNSRHSLRAKTEVTQVRFSTDYTFNTHVGRDLPRSPSSKSSLRLSGLSLSRKAYEFSSMHKIAQATEDPSPTTLASPASKFSVGEEHAMPTFAHHYPEDDSPGDV